MSETIRTVKSGRFSIIDNQMLENATLSLQAKGLQAYLLSRADGWTISPSHLATTCSGGVSQIKATLRELEIARYIHREQLRDNKGRMTGWVNWIYENPSLNPYPARTLSRSRKPASGKPADGKSTPINTESNKTERKKDPGINTHSLTTEPEKSADANSAIDQTEILDCEFWNEPEPPAIPSKPEPVKKSSSDSNPVSGEGESSAACRISETAAITAIGYLAKVEQRYTNALNPLELSELVQTLVDTYNKSKPASWGTCTKIGVHLTKQVKQMLEVYCEDVNLSAAVENIKNDVGAAFLSLRRDKYYDNSDFGNKTIGFFLNGRAVDRMRTRAQVWYDKPQTAKETAAKAIVQEIINGVPDWATGEILSDRQYRSYARRYRKNLSYAADHEIWTVMPTPEYLHKHFPQIFEAESC